MLLHCPPLAEGWAGLMVRVRKGYRISQRHRELAICAVAAMTGADYEFHHHVQPLIDAGGNEAQVKALDDVAAAAVADEPAGAGGYAEFVGGGPDHLGVGFADAGLVAVDLDREVVGDADLGQEVAVGGVCAEGEPSDGAGVGFAAVEG